MKKNNNFSKTTKAFMSNPDLMLAHLLVKNSFISLMSYLYVLKHGKINSIGKQRKFFPLWPERDNRPSVENTRLTWVG